MSKTKNELSFRTKEKKMSVSENVVVGKNYKIESYFDAEENLAYIVQIRHHVDGKFTRFNLAASKELRSLTEDRILIKLVGAMADQSKFESLDFSSLDLSGVELKDLTAQNCRFTYANLIGSEFDHSNLSDCQFISTNMTGVKIRHSKISFTTFENADMVNALLSDVEMMAVDLRSTDLTSSRFYRMNLDSVRFDSAKLGGLEFHDCTMLDYVIGHEFVYGTLPVGCSVAVTSKTLIVRCFDDMNNMMMSVAVSGHDGYNSDANRLEIKTSFLYAVPEGWQWELEENEEDAKLGRLMSESLLRVLSLLKHLDEAENTLVAMVDAGIINPASNITY